MYEGLKLERALSLTSVDTLREITAFRKPIGTRL